MPHLKNKIILFILLQQINYDLNMSIFHADIKEKLLSRLTHT